DIDACRYVHDQAIAEGCCVERGERRLLGVGGPAEMCSNSRMIGGDRLRQRLHGYTLRQLAAARELGGMDAVDQHDRRPRRVEAELVDARLVDRTGRLDRPPGGVTDGGDRREARSEERRVGKE